jgi:hypothetical protein
VTAVNGDVSCVASGSNPLAHGCNSTGDCQQGLTCGGGACKPYCTKAGSACGTGLGNCLQYFGPDGGNVPNATICEVPCDPEDAGSCGGPSGSPLASCQPDGLGGIDCFGGVGTHTQNQSCSATTFCAANFVCINAGGGTCAQWCIVANGGAECPANSTFGVCDKLNPDVNVGGVEYGVCQ